MKDEPAVDPDTFARVMLADGEQRWGAPLSPEMIEQMAKRYEELAKALRLVAEERRRAAVPS